MLRSCHLEYEKLFQGNIQTEKEQRRETEGRDRRGEKKKDKREKGDVEGRGKRKAASVITLYL